jgi:hypothetical protein
MSAHTLRGTKGIKVKLFSKDCIWHVTFHVGLFFIFNIFHTQFTIVS